LRQRAPASGGADDIRAMRRWVQRLPDLELDPNEEPR
jgi:hypothetical protein